MKFALALFSLVFSLNAQAAAQLVCQAEDGSQLQATIYQQNVLTDIRVQIRDGQLKAVADAHVALFDLDRTSGVEKVRTLILKDGKGRIFFAIASGALVDASGTYELEACEISY